MVFAFFALEVNSLIQSVLDKVAISNTTDKGYFGSNQLIQGLEQLKTAVAKGGTTDLEHLYSYKIINKNQVNQIQHALNYIYNTLPQNAIALLKYKSDGTKKGAERLIAELATSQLETEYQVDLDLENNTSSDNNNSIKSKVQLGPVELLLAGYGQKSDIIVQTPGGKQESMHIITTKMPITNNGQTNIGIGTLDDVAKSDFAGAL